MRSWFGVGLMGMGLLGGAPAYSDTAERGDTGQENSEDTGSSDSGSSDSGDAGGSGTEGGGSGVPTVTLSGETGGFGCAEADAAWFLVPLLAWRGRRRR